MPCKHGEVFWWDCKWCEEDKRIEEHNAELHRWIQIRDELKRIRELLEAK